jgi:hypothetical protein
MKLVVAREGWCPGAIPGYFDELDVPAQGALTTTTRVRPDTGAEYQYYALDVERVDDLLAFIEANGGVAALVYPPHAAAADGPTLVFPDVEEGIWREDSHSIWEPAHWRDKTGPDDRPGKPGALR